MSLGETLGFVVNRLDRAGIAHMLSGSLASTHHGEPRSTQDIDLVVDPTPEALDAFIASIERPRFYVDDARAALARRGQCSVIDTQTGWKVDLIMRKYRPFSVVELERREPLTVLGVATSVAAAEDVILSKLEWARASASERQQRDVVAILRLRAGELDDGYLDAWAAELGIVPDLQAARAGAR